MEEVAVVNERLESSLERTAMVCSFRNSEREKGPQYHKEGPSCVIEKDGRRKYEHGEAYEFVELGSQHITHLRGDSPLPLLQAW